MSKQELLQKYLNEECSREELHLLYQNLQKDEVEEYEEVLYKLWKELASQPVQALDEKISESVYDKIMCCIKKDSKNK